MTENAIAIEKGVEIPPPTRNQPNKYPFESMEPGDSFLIAGEGEENFGRVRKRAYAAVAWANRRYKTDGRRYVARSLESDGVRVWRQS